MLHHSYTETYDGPDGHMYHFAVTCTECGNVETISVRGPDLYSYNQGEYIQRAFPYLSAAQREMLMTKICGTCFDRITAWE